MLHAGMRRKAIRLAALASFAAAYAVAPALAQSNQGGILWHCVQQRDASYHVACSPQAIESGSAEHPSSAVAASTSADPPATFMGRDMRPVATRGGVEVFSAPAWRVPLHAPPSDKAAVAQLLDAVLCGNASACGVSYEGMRHASAEGPPLAR